MSPSLIPQLVLPSSSTMHMISLITIALAVLFSLATATQSSSTCGENCTSYGYPKTCSSTCDVIFDQIYGCSTIRSESDGCYCYVPSEYSLSAIACRQCLTLAANSTLVDLAEAVDDIQGVLDVCGFSSGASSTSLPPVTTATSSIFLLPTAIPVISGQSRAAEGSTWIIFGSIFVSLGSIQI
ncbi:hypothetical protein CFIMG_000439RAa [Ceratocystis fimbriata CBS 114723]|uniref:Extracellular membrane protein CFEM domain-containing protein n=1 Tax=Ceratocystis fimbriata CBS 114723 TaxID=1035309 RepID=A0A2C5XMY4_9PEZI|nr:hypothetical protein CFIMG_000439RAa [Ceratocystis fimbriata CBS 114723]